MSRPLAAICFGLLLLACGPTEAATPQPPQELKFGVTPFMNVDALHQEFQPIVDYITKKTRIQTTLYIARDYEDLGAQMRLGTVDMGSFSPAAYVQAAQHGGIEAFLQAKLDGAYSYKGVIIARKGSGINEVQDLAGKRFAYMSKTSASGYLYPRAMLLENGISSGSFAQMAFVGPPHEKVIEAVLSGQYDAGALSEGVYEFQRQNGNLLEALQVIGETDPIPNDAIAIRAALDDRLKENLRQLLSAMSYTLEGKIAFSKSRFGRGGFALSSDKEFDIVRKVIAMDPD